MTELDSFLDVLPKIAGHPLALVAYVCVAGAWLWWGYRFHGARTFLAALEHLPAEQRVRFCEISGYKYDELSNVAERHRLELLTKRYLLMAYVVSVVALVFLGLAVINSTPQTNQVDALTPVMLSNHSSRPEVYLYLRKRGTSSLSDDYHRERLEAEARVSNEQRARSIGFVSSSMRSIMLPFGPTALGPDERMIGFVQLHLGEWNGQVFLTASGLLDAMPFGPDVSVREVSANMNATDRVDAFALTFVFSKDMNWATLYQSVRERWVESKPLLKVAQWNVARNDAAPVFDEAAVVYKLSESPRIAIIVALKVGAVGYEGNGDYCYYELQAAKEPQLSGETVAFENAK